MHGHYDPDADKWPPGALTPLGYDEAVATWYAGTPLGYDESVATWYADAYARLTDEMKAQASEKSITFIQFS